MTSPNNHTRASLPRLTGGCVEDDADVVPAEEDTGEDTRAIAVWGRPATVAQTIVTLNRTALVVGDVGTDDGVVASLDCIGCSTRRHQIFWFMVRL